MSPLLDLALRVTAVLLLALSATAVMRRHSAARRHAVLAAGLAGALLVGPLSWIAPAWTPLPAPKKPLPDGPSVPIDVGVTADGPLTASAAGWEDVLLPAWLVGSTLLGVWLLVRLARIRRHTRAATGISGHWTELLRAESPLLGIDRRVELRVSPHVTSPATWGWRSPVILLPDGAETWEPARARMVLRHELAHIARGDWPVLLLGELAVAAYWWHPMVWLVRARARKESECACDDLVLAGGISATDYGTELVRLARRHVHPAPRASVVAMAHPSSLERRVTAMLDATRTRHPLTRRAAVTCGVVLAAALLPMSAFRLLAQDTPESFVVQVFDPSGAVLPGVAIVLGDARQGSRSTTTEGSGRAVFDGVAPGEYTISATLPGFRTLNGSFTIRAGRDRQRSITLQVGEITETVSVSARRPRSAAPSAGAVVEPLRVGGNIKVPRKLTHVAPEYPSAMRDAGLDAVVPIEALIGRDGTVASTRVLSAYVHPEFARAAANAVSQWVFSPTLLNGEAVEVRMNVSVRFSLED